jgi:hypothetical protein
MIDRRYGWDPRYLKSFHYCHQKIPNHHSILILNLSSNPNPNRRNQRSPIPRSPKNQSPNYHQSHALQT